MNGSDRPDDDPGEDHTERRSLVGPLLERFVWQLIGVTVIITLIVVIASLTR